MTIRSEQGGNDHDNLAELRRRLKSKVEMYCSGKVGRIKLIRMDFDLLCSSPKVRSH